MAKEDIKGKRRARKLVLQALYQWSMSGHELYEIEAQFFAANKMDKVDTVYFRKLLYGIAEHLITIEEHLKPYLDRTIEGLNPIELAVLRLGGYELLFCPEIPFKVILDEAVLLTKEFGSQDGYRYVNGVLNNLAKQIRKVEINLK